MKTADIVLNKHTDLYSYAISPFLRKKIINAMQEFAESQNKEFARKAWDACKESNFTKSSFLENVKTDFKDIGKFDEWYNQQKQEDES